ncbi:MAG: glutamate--cysteine ligase [Propionicimonas sp.]|uniref:glutamate--cysteine ligase n=1 Tax=Propionicimonas sp. TaxID=1955623 RepID=UPI002B20D6E4|nr:glutamate--cysteine ligase [Propionicimonas sp.]MEA4943995.1 glutamate--cysteine ligase [Propionicimonas sp.]MEA5118229.1 glutamate--cysteine ligase [Propionicimonas sp.]
MQVDFNPSPRSSIGLEWELALVDATTLELVPAASIVLDVLGWDDDAPVRKEYLQNMLELVSAPHQRVADAVADLADSLARVRRVLDPLGIRVLATGSHPFSIANQQQPFQGARYDVVKSRTQWWGRQMAICGTHIHVGIDHRDLALPVTNGLARFYPFFLALSASSPFWEGTDTGYASQRTMIFQQLPTNGLPYRMTRWSEFEAYATELAEVGMINVPGEIRWDVRPSPKFGTVENRTPDAVPTLAELGCLAALSQCLTEFVARDYEHDHIVEDLPPWLVKENKWRAARYGLDAEVITPDRPGRVRPLRDYLTEWIDRLLPVARDLDCVNELLFADTLANRGASYQRQHTVAADTGGDLRAVTTSLLNETGAPSPFD